MPMGDNTKKQPGEPGAIRAPMEMAGTNPFKKNDAWIGLAVHTEGPSLAKEFGRVELHIDNVTKDQFEATYLWKAFTQKLEAQGEYPITGKVRDDDAITWSGTDNVTGTGSLKGGALFLKWRQPPFVGENWYVPAEVAAKSKLRFVGTYQIIENGKTAFTLTLRPNGSATKSHEPLVNGGWLASTDQILVVWTDGWRDVLTPEGQEFKKVAFGPGLSISGKPSNTGLAKKTK